MKRVYSCKFTIYLSFSGIILFSAAMILGLSLMINDIQNGNSDTAIVYSLLSLFFIGIIALCVFELNREGYRIEYDADSKTVSRKGFICGYKFEIKSCDIKEILLVSFPRETTFYVLVDPINTKFDGGSKKSFIRIEKNEKNHNFIKQFWDKPIKEIKNYSDLFIKDSENN